MCEESSHMCEASSHFHHPSCLACLFHACPLHMRVKLTHTCVRSHASHTSSTPHAHVTIKGFSHMCEYLAPFDWSKTLIHVESTWPPPHWSWEILSLHLAFDLNRLLHLISYKRRALSSFSTSTIYLIFMLLYLWATTSHEWWNHLHLMVLWGLHSDILNALMLFFVSCCLFTCLSCIFWGLHNHVGIDVSCLAFIPFITFLCNTFWHAWWDPLHGFELMI